MGFSLVHVAIQQNHLGLVDWLLQRGVSPEIGGGNEGRGKKGCFSPLELASRNGNLAAGFFFLFFVKKNNLKI